MALIGVMHGEMKIVSPAGNVKIWVSRRGRVAVSGSRQLWEADWYLDQIKAAREAIRTGKAPQEFAIGGTEKTANKRWYLKMLAAGEDVVRGYGLHRKVGDGPPDANKVLEATGSPYRVAFK